MNRFILVRNDVLTSCDLRAQIFRVNVEFSTCYRGRNFFSKKCRKVTGAKKKCILKNTYFKLLAMNFH